MAQGIESEPDDGPLRFIVFRHSGWLHVIDTEAIPGGRTIRRYPEMQGSQAADHAAFCNSLVEKEDA